MKKIIAVFGTRPEAVKMCPLIIALKNKKNIQTVVCVTGQHRELLNSVLEDFELVPDYNLNVMKEKQSLFDVTINILSEIKIVLQKENPDMILVHGDTTTAFAVSLASFYMQIPVGHIEAGLRTYNLEAPFPEEFNRQAIDLVSKFYFVPTQHAKNNLLKEGKSEESIYVTGNTGIDALKYTIKQDYQSLNLEWTGNKKIVLVTAHRRENINSFEKMFIAIRRIANFDKDIKIVFPLHLNPIVRNKAKEILGDLENVRLTEPMSVVEFQNTLKRSYLVLTDSGGVQEEATALGVPALVMRDTTERPEAIETGNLKLIGTNSDDIYEAVMALLSNDVLYSQMCKSNNVFGDGTASEKIANILEEKLC